MLKYLLMASLIGGVLTTFVTSWYQNTPEKMSAEQSRDLMRADYRRDPALTLKALSPAADSCLAAQGRSDYSPEYRASLHRTLIAVLETGLKDGANEEKQASLMKWLGANGKELMKNLSEAEKDDFGDELKRISGAAFAVCVIKAYPPTTSRT